jgi:hypothetical protein
VHNAHPLLALKISRKKIVRVYTAHGLSKKIAVGNVRIKSALIYVQIWNLNLYLPMLY